MYTNQYQHEYEVRVITDTYHRDALRAEQVRIAKAGRRGLVRSLFSSARQAIVQAPVARPKLVTVPSDTALIA